MRVVRAVGELLAPATLVVASALLGATFARSTEIYFINALVMVSIVVALYAFVGNSGVLSFGHISFFALGVWGAGVLSIPEQEKPATMPYLFDFLSSTTVGNVPSLVIAALVGGVFALLVGCRSCACPGSRPGSRPSRSSGSRTTSSATTRRSGRD